MPSKVIRSTSQYLLCLAIAVMQCVASPSFAAGIQAGFELRLADLSALETYSIDLDPPRIEHTPYTEAISETNPTISVNVVDEQGMAEVTLFHRFAGQATFASSSMFKVAGIDSYSTTLDLHGETGTIEYYFSVVDIGGNRVLSGLPYQPYTLQLLTPASHTTANNTSATEAQIEESTASIGLGQDSTTSKSNRIWIALGAIALAALAVSSSDSGSNNTTSDSDSNVSVVVVVPVP